MNKLSLDVDDLEVGSFFLEAQPGVLAAAAPRTYDWRCVNSVQETCVCSLDPKQCGGTYTCA